MCFSDITPMTGFFGGKCKSSAACVSTPVEVVTPPPTLPGKPAGTCHCLDPAMKQCPQHKRCIVFCELDCPDVKKGKRGTCSSYLACGQPAGDYILKLIN